MPKETVVADSIPSPVAEVETEPKTPQSKPVVSQPERIFSDSLLDGGSGPRVVLLNADSYHMGSSQTSANFDERPRHEVQLDRFAIGQYEVTFEQYDRFAKATGRRLPADEGWGRGARPVINVSWQDAVDYTQWLSDQTGNRYRLPTEAEWEFAARTGNDMRFWWGNELDEGAANCFDCVGGDGDAKTLRVGSFSASDWQLYDMAGNVMEWVQDCYQPDYSDVPSDGAAVDQPNCTNRVVRGGGYNSPGEKLRSSSRDQRAAESGLDHVGFRVVRDY
jgi:formylglycine-generating enzyme required for sulfatase activity